MSYFKKEKVIKYERNKIKGVIENDKEREGERKM